MSTAVILAGGKSSRMGRDKLTLDFNGVTLLESAVARYSDIFEQVYLSVADPDKYPNIQNEKIEDIYKGCGPMAGLHAALKRTDSEGIFLVAADLPYSNPKAAMRIIELCGAHDAAMMADDEGRYEPLFAYYKKKLLPHIEALLSKGNYKMISLLDLIDLRVISKAELGEVWQDKLLLNINRIEDYQKLINKSDGI